MAERHSSVPSLDEWVEKNAADLQRDVEIHCKVWECEDQPGLVRMIMISVRNWAELSPAALKFRTQSGGKKNG